MTQDHTPNFIRPGMTQDADPAKQAGHRESSVGDAFAEHDPATQAPATAEDRKRMGNPLEAELTTHDALAPDLQAHQEPGK